MVETLASTYVNGQMTRPRELTMTQYEVLLQIINEVQDQLDRFVEKEEKRAEFRGRTEEVLKQVLIQLKEVRDEVSALKLEVNQVQKERNSWVDQLTGALKLASWTMAFISLAYFLYERFVSRYLGGN